MFAPMSVKWRLNSWVHIYMFILLTSIGHCIKRFILALAYKLLDPITTTALAYILLDPITATALAYILLDPITTTALAYRPLDDII